MGISWAINDRDEPTASVAPSPRRVAVFYGHINFLALGTLVELAKRYADNVYLITEGKNDQIDTLARSLGAEVIENKGDGARPLDIIRHDAGIGVLVALYGDGTHDPYLIPRLIAPVENGCDVAIGITPGERFHVNENVLFLQNKKAAPSGSGFFACSGSYCAGEGDVGRLRVKAGYPSTPSTKYVDLSDDSGSGVFDRHKVGVVIPAYNEEQLLEDTLKAIPPYVSKFYVIDDCSADGTPEIIKKTIDPRMTSVRHERNRGVGAAIVTGYKLALADGMAIVAVMAGDNQMDPKELPRLLMPIVEGRADYTKGNRLLNKKFRKGMSRWRSLGNFLLTMITKIGSGYWHVSDPQNGYTAISRKALEALDLDSVYTYYGYCNDLLIKLNTFGIVVLDIAMPAKYGKEKSSIKYSRFIFKVAPMIFRGFLWRLKVKYMILDFHPLVFFYMASMLLLPIGTLFSVWVLAEKAIHGSITPAYPILAALITFTGLQLFLFGMIFDMQMDKDKTPLSRGWHHGRP